MGRSLLPPLRRDRQHDFVTGQGQTLRRTQVEQVLLTRGATPQGSGELPWRTAFGAGLDGLRHQPNDAALVELARVQVRDALQRWLPQARVVKIDVHAHQTSLRIEIQLAALEGEPPETIGPLVIARPR